MITLYTLPAAFGLRNPSPFCLKVEMALAHLNLDFEIATQANPRKAPKGKLPWLVDDGILPDSELILDYLDKKSGGGLFGDLSPLEMATGTAFTRLAEDHLYWMMVASRWLDDDWFQVIKRDFFGFLPGPAGTLFAKLARRQMRQTYNMHGLGRHSLAEQEQFARRDLTAISDQVSAHNYIAGDRLTVHDFAVASLLAGLLDNQPATWVSQIADQLPAVREYADRVQKETGIYSREMD
jgi:glutathione S-transferase